MALPLIAITGATGTQGGGVVKALLKGGKFKVRALTRKPHSAAAQALAAQGVEVWQADLDAPESLAKAFEGCHGVFLVTNYWEHLDAERETRQAVAAGVAAKAAGVKHLVWSSLEHAQGDWGDDVPLADGKYKVPHFDAKAEATVQLQKLGLPMTELITSIYNEDFLTFLKPSKGEDGAYTLAAADTGDIKLPWMYGAVDIGKAAAALFAKGPQGEFSSVGVASDHLTFAECARIMSEVTGKTIRYAPMPAPAYEARLKTFMPGHAPSDMTNMFRYFATSKTSVAALRPLESSHQLVPDITTFRQWAELARQQLIDSMP